MEDKDGVWRTVGGRRIFIKDGQSLSTAMRESGKFNTTSSDKLKRYRLIRKLTEEYKKDQQDFINSKLEELDKIEDIDKQSKRYKIICKVQI